MNDPVEPIPQPSAELAPGLEDTPVAKVRTWGPWSTLGWTLLVFLSYSFVQGVAAVVVSLMDRSFSMTPDLPVSGLGMALGTLAAALLGVGSLMILARARGWAATDYLAVRWPSGRTVVVCVGLALVLQAASDGLSYTLGQPIVPRFQVDVYRSAGSVWILFLGLAAGAPLFEETLLRGFLFRGLAESRVGPPGAIVLTAVLFALPHVQYELYQMGLILVAGLFLGVVRDRTGSVLVTILLHAIQNGVGLVETAVVVGGAPPG
jgi:membrane protease YdiL (CAAX protease family)